MPVYEATDVNVALKYFNHKIKNLFDKHAPISERRAELKIEMDN